MTRVHHYNQATFKKLINFIPDSDKEAMKEFLNEMLFEMGAKRRIYGDNWKSAPISFLVQKLEEKVEDFKRWQSKEDATHLANYAFFLWYRLTMPEGTEEDMLFLEHPENYFGLNGEPQKVWTKEQVTPRQILEHFNVKEIDKHSVIQDYLTDSERTLNLDIPINLPGVQLTYIRLH